MLVRIAIRSIAGVTLPGTCSKHNNGAPGNWRQTGSKHFSPPRIPVSQS